MKPEDQIRALAELDGWNDIEVFTDQGMAYLAGRKKSGIGNRNDVPDYLNSRDVIVGVIEKQSREVLLKVCEFFHTTGSERTWIIAVLLATPAQLAEGLLLTLGLWRDE